MKSRTVNEVIQDLQELVEQGFGEAPVTLYCVNCDQYDDYEGATGSSTGRKGSEKVQITINERR